MADRLSTAASHATGIGARTARTTDLPLPGEANPILDLLSALGLTDPLGVGQPQQHASLPPMRPGFMDKWLGKVISPAKSSTAVPPKLRVSSGTPSGDVRLYEPSASDAGTAYDIGGRQLQSLLKSGEMLPEAGPFEGQSLAQLVQKLEALVKAR